MKILHQTSMVIRLGRTLKNALHRCAQMLEKQSIKIENRIYFIHAEHNLSLF